jgi:ammonia channel protein AmtB
MKFGTKGDRRESRIWNGVALAVVGVVFTFGGLRAYNQQGGYDESLHAYASHNNSGLIGVAIGAAFLIAAIYQFVVAAIAQGVAEGRKQQDDA